MARERVKFCNAIRKITYEFSACSRCSAFSISYRDNNWIELGKMVYWVIDCLSSTVQLNLFVLHLLLLFDFFTKVLAWIFSECSDRYILKIILRWKRTCWIIFYIFHIFFSWKKKWKCPFDSEKFAIQNFVIKLLISE